MSLCQAIVPSTDRPCRHKAQQGSNTCGKHKNAQVLMSDMSMCGQMKADGKRCLKKCATGDTMCSTHRNVVDRRVQHGRIDTLWADALQMLWGDVPPPQFNLVVAPIEDAFARGWIDARSHTTLIQRLHGEWMWFRLERLLPTAQAKTDLERLAMDSQNVHTKEVSKQVSESTDYLLSIPVPLGQDTLSEIKSAWANKDSKKVMRDVKRWYGLSFCVKLNDWLYKRMLDGLWARIKSNPELVQRLWEEACESVDMCCQGHISRLSNVLVGFTDDVKAEVPVGEILQQKIAAIAEKEIPTTHKVGEAWGVFEELHIPMVERDAWIEAL